MTSIVANAIRAATQRLSSTSDTARLDAEVLMAHALGVTRSDTLLRHMRDDAPAGFAALVERRAAHEPVAYISGRQEFYGLDLTVSPAVLIPRGDSETLIEAAKAWFADRPPPRRIIDLGTGSGALLLAALSLWREAQGVALDASAAALAVAEANAARLGLSARTECVCRSWYESGWADDLGSFDLILCNPPYVEDNTALDASVRDYEPADALFSGPEGLDDYRVLIPQFGKLKNSGGAIVLEIGANQAELVTRLAQEFFLSATLHRDLAGRPRALLLA